MLWPSVVLTVWQVETPCGVANCTFVDPNKPVMVCTLLHLIVVLTLCTRCVCAERQRQGLT